MTQTHKKYDGFLPTNRILDMYTTGSSINEKKGCILERLEKNHTGRKRFEV